MSRSTPALSTRPSWGGVVAIGVVERCASPVNLRRNALHMLAPSTLFVNQIQVQGGINFLVPDRQDPFQDGTYGAG